MVPQGCRVIGPANDPDQVREIDGTPQVTTVAGGHRTPWALVQDLYASATHAPRGHATLQGYVEGTLTWIKIACSSRAGHCSTFSPRATTGVERLASWDSREPKRAPAGHSALDPSLRTGKCPVRNPSLPKRSSALFGTRRSV